MNQLCKVCDEPAAGFHFGAFTCEGCKSFFGRTYNNIGAISACKNGGDCVINKKNRTACKACRLRKCLHVGMSKSGSRYGRRSNWFKIHCLLQEQQQTQQRSQGDGTAAAAGAGGDDEPALFDSKCNLEQLAQLHQLQARQTHQDKMHNPFVATPPSRVFVPAALVVPEKSPGAAELALDQKLFAAAEALGDVRSGEKSASRRSPGETRLQHCKVVNTTDSDASTRSEAATLRRRTKTDTKRLRQQHNHARHHHHHHHHRHHHQHPHQRHLQLQPYHARPLAAQPLRNCRSEHQRASSSSSSSDDSIDREQQFLELIRSNSEPLKAPFITFVSAAVAAKARRTPAPGRCHDFRQDEDGAGNNADHEADRSARLLLDAAASCTPLVQDEPIDLSLKSRQINCDSQMLAHATLRGRKGSGTLADSGITRLVERAQKHAPLDLTLLRDDYG